MSNPRRIMWLLVPLAIVSLVAASCGDSEKDSDSAAATTTTTKNVAGLDIDYSKLTGTLNGSGASFQDTLQQTVIGAFKEPAPGLVVNYAKSGSGAGKADLAANTVQFAGTDSTIKPEDLAGFTGGEVLYFPIAAGPITVSFNVAGVSDLKLSADTIAGIFQSQITTWNDPKIAAENPDAKLPATTIAVVHRSDASGTTSNFTKFLTKAAPTVWTLGSGDTVNWPATTQGAEKNSGVATVISSTDGAIGYVDLADAVSANLDTAQIKNAAGKFVEPKLPNASAALAGAEVKDDLTFDSINAEGDTSYPITAPTYIIVYKTQPSAEVANNLKGYINFMLTEGQTLAPTVGYAALPTSLQEAAIEQLSSIGS